MLVNLGCYILFSMQNWVHFFGQTISLYLPLFSILPWNLKDMNMVYVKTVLVYMFKSTKLYTHVGFYYVVLGNLPPMFRSKVKHIHLAAIAKVDHLKKYGCNAILKPMIEDIKTLVSNNRVVN